MVSERKIGPSVETVPEGDDRVRLVCPDCGYISYENPKVVVGAVCVWQDRFLICRRAIEPRQGRWTIPAGYLELGETTADGARREVQEEAGAEVRIIGLLGLYEIPHINQVYVFHRAKMTGPEFAPGQESEAVELVQWADIPWDELAFPSVAWALRRYDEGGAPSHATYVEKTGGAY